MSFSTTTSAYTLFPSSPPAHNTFPLFSSTQLPHDAYNMYDDARQALCPPSECTAHWKMVKSSLKKLFS